jgi:hypothetical protein
MVPGTWYPVVNFRTRSAHFTYEVLGGGHVVTAAILNSAAPRVEWLNVIAIKGVVYRLKYFDFSI